jgi:hypothetical protein
MLHFACGNSANQTVESVSLSSRPSSRDSPRQYCGRGRMAHVAAANPRETPVALSFPRCFSEKEGL